MTQNGRKIYEFEGFRLDAYDLLLFRGEERLALRPKVVETLLAMVERNGQILRKEELMNIVWGDTAVEEGNLSQNMYLLRKALGTSGEGTPFIETLHRRGYRFSAEVKVNSENIANASSLNGHLGDVAANDTGLQNGNANYGSDADRVTTPRDHSRISVSAANKTLFFAAAAVVLLSVAGLVLLRPWKSPPPQGEMTLLHLTNGGDINDATISPDGKYFVYHEVDGDISHMWLQQTGTATRSEIIPPTTKFIASKTFSPDGQSLYFIASEKPGPVGSIYRVPVTGGVQTKIVDDAGLAAAVSPDGRRLAFLRNYTDRNATDLIIINNDGSNPRTLIASGVNHTIWGGLAWSPDGHSIAYGDVDLSDITASGACTIFAVDPEKAATRSLTTEKWDTCGRMAWTADGTGLMLIGTKEKEVLTTKRDQLFYLSISTGVSRRLTTDASRNEVQSLGVTTDNSVLIVPYNRSSQLWVMSSNGDQTTAKQITNGLADGRAGIAPLPNGKIGYIARTGGSLNIWTTAEDGSDPRQITAEPQLMEELRASPDGKYFYYSSPVDGMLKFFRCRADGSDTRQALDDPSFAVDSAISPDGNWIAYNSAVVKDGGTFASIRMAPADGGDFVQLTGSVATGPHFSPDGHFISFIDGDNLVNVVTVPDGKPVSKFTPGKVPILNVGAHWLPDGTALTYIVKQKSACNIWVQPLNGNPPHPLTDFTSGEITNYAFSTDGTRLIVARGYPIKDATLIKISY